MASALTQLTHAADVVHEKSLLLCRVAAGRPFQTKKNMDTLTAPPPGFHSVHGVAGVDLNFEEVVTYREESILPEAIVTYGYRRK